MSPQEIIKMCRGKPTSTHGHIHVYEYNGERVTTIVLSKVKKR